MKIHLVDGTYELFRSHFGALPKKGKSGLRLVFCEACSCFCPTQR